MVSPQQGKQSSQLRSPQSNIPALPPLWLKQTVSADRGSRMMVIRRVEDLSELGDQELEELYTWIDNIPLSRPKRSITRDFSDGVLVAEVIKHHFPKIVDVHNYSPANATPQKMQNWMLMNRKVFRQLQFELSEDVVRQISNAKAGLIERVLSMIRTRLERIKWESGGKTSGMKDYESEQPEADQINHKVSPRKPGKVPPGAGSGGNGDVDMGRYAGGGGGGGGAGLRPKAGRVEGKRAKLPMEETVPLLLLEEKEQEVLAKNETIQILQSKIKRLEHLLHLKDIRIEDLQNRVEAARPTGKR